MNNTAVQALTAACRGPVIRPGDPAYDSTRSVWNATVDRHPALIVRCTGTADVMAAVSFAREQGLPVSVRGGGHNVAGHAVCDDGVMIDLSLMRSISVDPKTRTARVQGGATGGDLDHETQAFGLATPSGIISTTGVGGLTLGGGFGWLSRLHGLAADNLLSVDLVTAKGTVITTNEAEHPDLFWGLRGGGGNFGIATTFEFQLHPVGPQVLFGPTIYRLKDAPHVLRHYREFIADAPRACSVYVDFLTAPPLPFLPPTVHGTKVLSLIQFYAGDLTEGERILRPLRAFGSPLADAVAPTPYVRAQSLSDPLYEKGASNYWKSHNVTALTDSVIDQLAACADALPTPQSDILIHQLGGAIQDKDPEATAYPHRSAAFVITPGGRWAEPGQGESCIHWVRSCHHELAVHAIGGTYVNFVSDREGGERMAYGRSYERLVELKNRYDPGNLFRFNQNIQPTI